MTQIQATTTLNQGKQQRSSVASVFVALIIGMLVCTALV